MAWEILVPCNWVTKSCMTFCDPMDCSMPGLPVLHYLPEFAQTHVPWVGDAIQPSHTLCRLLLLPSIFPSIRIFSISQLFASGSQSIGASASASILPMNIQDWFPLGLTDLIYLQSKGQTLKSLLQHHSLKASILQCSTLWSNSPIQTWQLEKPYLWLDGPLSAKWSLCFLIRC